MELRSEGSGELKLQSKNRLAIGIQIEEKKLVFECLGSIFERNLVLPRIWSPLSGIVISKLPGTVFATHR